MTKYTVEYWIERTDNAYPEKKETVDELPEDGDSVTIRGKPHVVTQVEENEGGYYEVYAMPRDLYEEQNSWRMFLGKSILMFSVLGFGILISIYKMFMEGVGKLKGGAKLVKDKVGDLTWE